MHRIMTSEVVQAYRKLQRFGVYPGQTQYFQYVSHTFCQCCGLSALVLKDCRDPLGTIKSLSSRNGVDAMEIAVLDLAQRRLNVESREIADDYVRGFVNGFDDQPIPKNYKASEAALIEGWEDGSQARAYTILADIPTA